MGAEVSGFQAQQLHVEDEGGVRGDDARVSFGAVGEVWGAGQLCPLTHAHLWPCKKKKQVLNYASHGGRP